MQTGQDFDKWGEGAVKIEIRMREQASLEGKLNHFGHRSLYLVKLSEPVERKRSPTPVSPEDQALGAPLG